MFQSDNLISSSIHLFFFFYYVSYLFVNFTSFYLVLNPIDIFALTN